MPPRLAVATNVRESAPAVTRKRATNSDDADPDLALTCPHRETPFALARLAFAFNQQHLPVLVEHDGCRNGQGVFVEDGLACGHTTRGRSSTTRIITS